MLRRDYKLSIKHLYYRLTNWFVKMKFAYYFLRKNSKNLILIKVYICRGYNTLNVE